MNALIPRRRRLCRTCAALLVLAAAEMLWADRQPPPPIRPANAPAANRLSDDRRRAVLRDALNAFDDAVAVARSDPERAADLYRSCVGALETLEADGVRSAALYYDLGNAYFRLGKLGRAIVNYRRARRLAPTDPEINANLHYARNRVEPYIKPGGGAQLLHRLLFWNNYTSMRQRFGLAAAAWIVGWGLLAACLRRRSTPVLAGGIVLLVLGGANALSVGWQLHEDRTHPAAVVVDGQYVLRLGRGEGYDPAITQPLGPGVELRIIARRGGWAEVELADGTTGWLPEKGVLCVAAPAEVSAARRIPRSE